MLQFLRDLRDVFLVRLPEPTRALHERREEMKPGTDAPRLDPTHR